MMTKQEFMEEYADFSKDELLEELYNELVELDFWEKHMDFLIEQIDEYRKQDRELKAEIAQKQKLREERMEYLKHELIPELEERRDKVATKRALAAWGIFAAVILWIFYITESLSSLSAIFWSLLASAIGSFLFLYVFFGVFSFTFQKNISDRHHIDCLEQEISFLKYGSQYFVTNTLHL